jgi:hypothetical protein
LVTRHAKELTCVANTSVVDLDTDLVGPGGEDLNVLDGKGLAGLPGDGGLASDGLRHEVNLSSSIAKVPSPSTRGGVLGIDEG